MSGGGSSPTLAPPPKCRKELSTTATTVSSREVPQPGGISGGARRCPKQRRRKARRAPPIHKLGEDLLLEIFLRLPSLATLVRAAFTCRAWRRAVASSPEFRRRFRAIHPAPLLGLFFNAPGPVRASNAPAFPTFIPSRRRGRDLSAVVRGGDFYLTTIQDLPEEAPSWEIVDCYHGCVLLMSWDFSSLIVFNPVARQFEDVFWFGCEDMFDGHRGEYSNTFPRLVISAEDPKSFRAVILVYEECRVRAVVFSSDTWVYSVHPWVDVPAGGGCRWIKDSCGMQANGHLYWAYENEEYLISLDTATMQFCVAELPEYLKDRTFNVGETKDGTTCIVFEDNNLNVGVMMPIRDNDGAERWVLNTLVPMDTELERALRVGLDDDSVVEHLVDDPSDLSVLAVLDGYVYLATWTDDPQTPCWLLSLCLETMRLERLFKNIFEEPAHPYIMAWPPSLVGNYGSFAVEDAPNP